MPRGQDTLRLNNQALIEIETTVNPGEDVEERPKEARRRGNDTALQGYHVNTFPERRVVVEIPVAETET